MRLHFSWQLFILAILSLATLISLVSHFTQQKKDRVTPVDKQTMYLQQLTNYLGSWTYKEVIPHNRWELYANDTQIGFIQNCDDSSDNTCIHYVPQTYGSAQKVSKYRLDKVTEVLVTKYDVAIIGDSETKVRQDEGFVFTFLNNPTHMLLVIYDYNLGAIQAFQSRLQGKELVSICDSAQTTLEMHNCAFQELKQAETDLDTTLSVIQTFAPKALFNSSQSSWKKYRDDYCSLLGHQYEGGNIQPVIIDNCLANLTRERIKELENLRGPY